jgi:hypothetical protein
VEIGTGALADRLAGATRASPTASGTSRRRRGRFRPTGGLRAESLDVFNSQSPARTLVRNRRRREAVAHDDGAARERGTDDLGHVLGAICEHQQQLGARIERRITVQQHIANLRADSGVARLERRHDFAAFGAQPLPSRSACVLFPLPRHPRGR